MAMFSEGYLILAMLVFWRVIRLICPICLSIFYDAVSDRLSSRSGHNLWCVRRHLYHTRCPQQSLRFSKTFKFSGGGSQKKLSHENPQQSYQETSNILDLPTKSNPNTLFTTCSERWKALCVAYPLQASRNPKPLPALKLLTLPCVRVAMACCGCWYGVVATPCWFMWRPSGVCTFSTKTTSGKVKLLHPNFPSNHLDYSKRNSRYSTWNIFITSPKKWWASEVVTGDNSWCWQHRRILIQWPYDHAPSKSCRRVIPHRHSMLQG